MKKIISILIVVLLAINLVGCKHEHTWVEATYDAPKTCSTCGETEGEPLPPPEPEFDLEAYKEKVKYCHDIILENTVILNNLASWISGYMVEYNKFMKQITFSDETLSKSYDWYCDGTGEDRSTIERNVADRDKAIKDSYKEIITEEIEGNEAIKIDESLREMFESYSALYTYVTSDNYSLYDFADYVNTLLHTFSSADNNISLFIN